MAHIGKQAANPMAATIKAKAILRHLGARGMANTQAGQLARRRLSDLTNLAKEEPAQRLFRQIHNPSVTFG
jgi:cysteine synthase